MRPPASEGEITSKLQEIQCRGRECIPAANLIWVEGRTGIMTVLPETVRACVRFKAEKTEEILKVLQEIKDN